MCKVYPKAGNKLNPSMPFPAGLLATLKADGKSIDVQAGKQLN